MAQSPQPPANTAVGAWLFACAGMVFAMAVIGAITRLTESGLSMVEWRPLIGWIPPLSGEEWDRVFGLYRQSPEYIHKNSGMDLVGFKQIFLWEWLHRVWGRLIGLVFTVPLIYFAIRRQIPKNLITLVIIAFILGAGQGVWGWYMVQSGLVESPSVSQYRLAGHLGLAFAIFALLIWMGCKAWRVERVGLAASSTVVRQLFIASGLVAVTVFWGALVAGLDAGLAYNTYPLMDGRFLPLGVFSIVPAWKNFFDNTALVQFTHRWLAIATMIAVIWSSFSLRPYAPKLASALVAMVLVQVTLGIATLLSFVAIPLATLHQAGALVLVGLLTVSLYRLLGAPELRAEQDQHGKQLQPAE